MDNLDEIFGVVPPSDPRNATVKKGWAYCNKCGKKIRVKGQVAPGGALCADCVLFDNIIKGGEALAQSMGQSVPDDVDSAFGLGQQERQTLSISNVRRRCNLCQTFKGGGLIICPKEYGDSCRNAVKTCIGCVWACTDCILLLKKAQATPRSQRPWSLKTELVDDSLAHAGSLASVWPGELAGLPEDTIRERVETNRDDLARCLREQGVAWVLAEIRAIIKG